MGYLKLALVLGIAGAIVVSFGFAGGQAWLLTILLAGLTLLHIELSGSPPRPYLIWITPKWEAIQAQHRIGSDAELRSWLDRSHEIVARSESTPVVLGSPATERELVDARVAVHGVGIQWLNQNLFLVSGFKMFTSEPEWDFFFEVSRDDPKNTLVFRCKCDSDGYAISIGPQHSSYFERGYLVGGITLATLPHEVFTRIRSGRSLHSTFFSRKLRRLGWSRATNSGEYVRSRMIHLEHQFLEFEVYKQ